MMSSSYFASAMSTLTLPIIFVVVCLVHVEGWSTDSVVLRDIDVLTLYNGRMTNSRRSSPIPQLKCTGGNAGCTSFVPQVVQCYNRGSDGFDVQRLDSVVLPSHSRSTTESRLTKRIPANNQWECKTDMDNAYRFGQIEVSCEGYEHPDDPYVLRGSCGLEYTLDLTKEGQQRQSGGGGQHHNYYQDNQHSSWSSLKPSKRSSWMGDVIMLVIVGVVVYAIYHTCIANTGDYGGGNHDQDAPRDRRSGNRPPPYGFRQDSMPGDDDSGSCSGSRGGGTYSNTSYRSPGGTGAGNFWTGAATGGLLGYLFGSRTNTYQQPYGYGGGYGQGGGWGGMGSGWGGGRRSYGGGGSMFGGGLGGSSFGGSSGTRTASGFGGTRRR